MRMTIVAAGRLKSGPEHELCQRYLKRTNWQITLKEIEEKQVTSPNQRKKKEAEKLLHAIPSSSYIIALDEHGKTMTSQEWASMLSELEISHSQIAFVIGGADGIDETLLKKAQRKVSFGKNTWPHMMVRAMLLEQLYRAHTILTNHPYHRE